MNVPDRHEAQASLDDLDATREQLRSTALRTLGVSHTPEHTPPLRRTLRRYQLGIYPLAALGVLAIVHQFAGYAFGVLAPEIGRTLGVGKGGIAGLIALNTLAIALAPLPMAALAQRNAGRALLCVAAGLVCGVFAVATGYVTVVAGLAVCVAADGLTTGSVAALHRPLLLDSYPAEARVRVLSGYEGFTAFGRVAAPLLVAFLSTWLGLTWRGVFAVLGAVAIGATAITVRLRDPGLGRWDTERVRTTIRSRSDDATRGTPVTDADVALGFFETLRRVMLIPTVHRVLGALAMIGVLLVPYQTFLFFFLEERWDLDAGGRGLFFAFTSLVSVVALGAFGRRGEARFREDPGAVARLAGVVLAIAVVCIGAAGLSPWFAGMVVCFSLSSALLAILAPAVMAVLFAVVPAEMRPHTGALAGIFIGGVGGLFGALFLSGIDTRFGVAGVMVSLVLPGVVGALLLARTARLVPDDLHRMVDEIVEQEEISHVVHAGGHLPIVACRGVDFSYGSLQVLFGVDFTVAEGEMVALLGVNGAGKSTLLKVLSGVGLPSRGSVRFRGTDITYLDAERRLPLGITQISGGQAIFPRLSVIDNLRGFAFSLGRDRRSVERAIDRSLDTFSQLAERRDQRAGTLSGGEQQMLALAKALILQPTVLLIDELTLGLAPVVAVQLVDMVRAINAAGTAVVLVEQSIDVAADLADHAYFMERGVIRFDGAATELLTRDDLLRPVFLDGLTAAKDEEP
jgi:ABC-type branched-subunit amino acid transport system ATPase component